MAKKNWTFGDFRRAMMMRGFDIDNDDTYDYQAYFRADPQAAMKTARRGGHFPDKFKTPEHPTFSDESEYSTPGHQGGTWTTSNNGTDVFVHSPYTKQHVDETDDYLGRDYRETGNVSMSHDGETFRLPTVEVKGKAKPKSKKKPRSIFDVAKGAK